ncbi:hypothetical protein phiAS5_ORF0288 [Aeromonas phage phiAS5]|uniref:Uncharacterized protein n=1 Tax=Aeromonas phage phiAS5 TaxID=879630 RepID=E1A242_9CAUD|nr:hypothetical protein phiAS5_ORF0288 [Aeromonas phage phiAS5]ADM80131.1 hypothetical protein phiAS5_ORF0288 [Aeromonas phage phiAS5]BES53107.1 hypothetical protein [Aeromonas phage phiWae14]
MSSIIEFIFANVKMYGEAMEKIHGIRFIKDDIGFDMTKNNFLIRFEHDGKDLVHRMHIDLFRSQQSIASHIERVKEMVEANAN